MFSVTVDVGSPSLGLCGPPQVGAPPITSNATIQVTPFDDISIAAGVAALLLLLAIAAALVVRSRRREAPGSPRLIVLAAMSLLFAALAAGWIWQLRTSYISGCVIYFNAAPFSQEQAFWLAPLLVVVVAALAALWLAVLVRLALRQAPIPASPLRTPVAD
jgi:hypothetical protein